MKKLYNNEPGSLKSKFEDFEAAPSFGAWGGVQSELAKLNRAKRRRHTASKIGAVIGASALVFFALHNSVQRNYEARELSVQDASHSNSAFDFPSYHVRQVSANDQTMMAPQANQNTGLTTVSYNQASNSVAQVEQETQAVAVHTLGDNGSNVVQPLDLTLSVPKATKPVDGIDYGHLRLITDTNPNQHVEDKQYLWYVDLRSGTDIGRGLTQLVEGNSLYGNSSASQNGSNKDFGPYQINNPTQINLSLRRQLTPRYSMYAGFQGTIVRGIALTEANNGDFSKLEGRQKIFGLIAGFRADMKRFGRIMPFVSGDLYAARVSSGQFTTIDYENYEVVNTTTRNDGFRSLFIGANGTLGLRYHMLKRIALEGGVVVSKPLADYGHELNPYDENLTIGSRFGVSVSF